MPEPEPELEPEPVDFVPEERVVLVPLGLTLVEPPDVRFPLLPPEVVPLPLDMLGRVPLLPAPLTTGPGPAGTVAADGCVVTASGWVVIALGWVVTTVGIPVATPAALV